MNIHGLKNKIKQAKSDYRKKEISKYEYDKRRNRYNYAIQKIRDWRKKQKRK